jgi:hypothetical protein
MYSTFLIHSSVVGHLGCFHSLAIVNTAVMNFSVQVSNLYPELCSFRYMLRTGILDYIAFVPLSFLKNLHTAPHNGCTKLHPIRVPVSLHPWQHLLLFLPLNMVIVTGVL